jgi:hypothetical protein
MIGGLLQLLGLSEDVYLSCPLCRSTHAVLHSAPDDTLGAAYKFHWRMFLQDLEKGTRMACEHIAISLPSRPGSSITDVVLCLLRKNALTVLDFRRERRRLERQILGRNNLTRAFPIEVVMIIWFYMESLLQPVYVQLPIGSGKT